MIVVQLLAKDYEKCHAELTVCPMHSFWCFHHVVPEFWTDEQYYTGPTVPPRKVRGVSWGAFGVMVHFRIGGYA